MAETNWAVALKALKPFVFKIFTPHGTGTGFQIAYAEHAEMIGIATALHVLGHAHEWEEPLKLQRYSTKETKVVRDADRAIFTYPDKDLAFLIFKPEDLDVEESSLNMIAADMRLAQGVRMGWCGFPAVASAELCFFSGHMSTWLSSEKSYLVDGVAINGVSGGPAFTVKNNKPRICGVVSAYRPNRATGESLPGVCVIRDVAPYQDVLEQLNSVEEAAERARHEAEEQRKEEQPETSEPPASKQKTAKKKATKKKPSRKAAAKKKRANTARKKVSKKKVTRKRATKGRAR